MTLTFNRDTYGMLLAKYQPKVIETDQENEQAIALSEELSHRENPTVEELVLLQLLITLIEKYEEEHYPIIQVSPNDILIHLMESRNLDKKQLTEILGSDLITQNILTGEQEISDKQAKILSDFFHVSPDLFRSSTNYVE